MSFDESSEARFAAFVEALIGAIGHADRAAPLRHYCTGLLMPAERRSVARKNLVPDLTFTKAGFDHLNHLARKIHGGLVGVAQAADPA